MPTIPTFDEMMQAWRTEVGSRNPRLTDFRPGSALDALGGASALLADESIRVALEAFAAQYLDSAEDADLDALVQDRTGLTRNAAAAAVVTVTFTRGSSFQPTVITIPAGTRLQATNDDGEAVVFTTDSDADIVATSNTVSTTATASTAGEAGNVALGAIDSVLDTIAGDSTLSVANSVRATGGAEEETDDELRDRYRRYFPTLRQGTVGALQAGALNIAGVRYAAVDESEIGSPNFRVNVYIGDVDGRGNAALAALVAAAFLTEIRAAGVQVQVSAATREEIALSLALRVRQGADTDTLRANVRAAVLAYTNGLNPHAKLYLARVEAEAQGVVSAILSATATTSATTTDPGDGNVYIAPSSASNALRVPSTSLSISITEV